MMLEILLDQLGFTSLWVKMLKETRRSRSSPKSLNNLLLLPHPVIYLALFINFLLVFLIPQFFLSPAGIFSAWQIRLNQSEGRRNHQLSVSLFILLSLSHTHTLSLILSHPPWKSLWGMEKIETMMRVERKKMPRWEPRPQRRLKILKTICMHSRNTC